MSCIRQKYASLCSQCMFRSGLSIVYSSHSDYGDQYTFHFELVNVLLATRPVVRHTSLHVLSQTVIFYTCTYAIVEKMFHLMKRRNFCAVFLCLCTTYVLLYFRLRSCFNSSDTEVSTHHFSHVHTVCILYATDKYTANVKHLSNSHFEGDCVRVVYSVLR